MNNPVQCPPSPLSTQINALRDDVEGEAQNILTQYCADTLCLTQNKSAKNLAHYLALRRHDLRQIQEQLAEAGISSLGRCEAHVMHTLNRVVEILRQGYSHTQISMQELKNGPSYHEGKTLLNDNCARLFGPADAHRNTRIMVTLPAEAGWNLQLVHDLIAAGMNCARINCAHDDKNTWRKMVENIIKARAQTGKDCAIMMDLAGQKIRTQLEAEPASAIKHQPKDDDESSARLLFYPNDGPDRSVTAEHQTPPQIALPAAIFKQLQSGDRFHFEKPNGKQRHIDLLCQNEDGDWIGALKKKAGLDLHTQLHWQRRDPDGDFRTIGSINISGFAARARELLLYADDTLLLARNTDSTEHENGVPRVACSHPEIIDSLSPGHWVWFDDGKLGTQIDKIDAQGAWLRVIHSRPNGVKLRTDKGINLPDTHLQLPCLSEKDLDDLDFICRHADIVGYSFVQSRDDMLSLMAELDQRNANHLAIIAKIETRVAVKNLPAIIFSALSSHRLGVMIARGDLAVELGGERLAEIQEEILWLCEAAHVPVIWATQVLETLAKKGISSRPELTDAAMSGRAECVMLNKGPYILNAVATLNSILMRMQDHQQKKRSQLRALHW